MHESRGGFELHITNIESLILFCALLRSEDLDEEKLRELAARLTTATTVLSEAQTADAKKRKR